MNHILPQAQELLSTLKQLMPSIYQQETLESVLGLFLQGQGISVPHHCQTKSESAISRFLNHYKWSTRSLIRYVRSCLLNLILSQRKKGRKPILEVILDLTTLEKVGNFPHLKNLVRVYHHKKGLHIVVMYLVMGNWRFPWSFRVNPWKGDSFSISACTKIIEQFTQIFASVFSDLCFR